MLKNQTCLLSNCHKCTKHTPSLTYSPILSLFPFLSFFHHASWFYLISPCTWKMWASNAMATLPNRGRGLGLQQQQVGCKSTKGKKWSKGEPVASYSCTDLHFARKRISPVFCLFGVFLTKKMKKWSQSSTRKKLASNKEDNISPEWREIWH